jgi:hypothetical protein
LYSNKKGDFSMRRAKMNIFLLSVCCGAFALSAALIGYNIGAARGATAANAPVPVDAPGYPTALIPTAEVGTVIVPAAKTNGSRPNPTDYTRARACRTVRGIHR